MTKNGTNTCDEDPPQPERRGQGGRRRRGLLRREEIAAAARMHFAERGFHGTHVADIAARAGIAKSSFFHYFTDKAALYDELVGGELRELESAIDSLLRTAASTPEALDAVVEVIVGDLGDDRVRARLVFRALHEPPPHCEGEVAAPLLHHVAAALRAGVEERGSGIEDNLWADRLAFSIVALAVAEAVGHFATALHTPAQDRPPRDARVARAKALVRGLLKATQRDAPPELAVPSTTVPSMPTTAPMGAEVPA